MTPEKKQPPPCPGYTRIRPLSSGSYGTTFLEKCGKTGDKVVVKYLDRDCRNAPYLERELVIHRKLRHRHIIAFKKAVLLPTHIAVVLEYAAGGAHSRTMFRMWAPQARPVWRSTQPPTVIHLS